MKNTILIVAMAGFLLAGYAENPGPDGKQGKVKNIILLIGDGMGVSQVCAALTAQKGHLNIAEMKDIGFSKTHSYDNFITDSGAGGTAIATGHKTYDHAIGVDKDTIPRKSILEYASDHGKATGIVVTSQVTHATPASFVAHQKDRYMYEAIAEDYLKTDIDVFIGGGRDHFSKRKDGLDLTLDLAGKGYQLIYDLDDLEKIKHGKVAGLLYENAPPRWSEGRDDMLPASVSKAIELLSMDKDGFFLLVEGSQIDWGGHDNDSEYLLQEMADFDRAVGEALEFARSNENTLVIVTADHETGGMSLTGGNISTGELQADYTTTGHTGVMVPVFTYGPGSEKFMGIFENTDLFDKMMESFGFSSVHDVDGSTR